MTASQLGARRCSEASVGSGSAERVVVALHPVEDFWAILQDFDGYPADV